MSAYYDREGRPITLEDWAQLRGEDYRRVGGTHIGQLWVSTVWLGLDHGFPLGPDEDNYRPLIFETMVFGPGSCSELFMARYSTLADAQAGHVEACLLAKQRKHGWTKAARDYKRSQMKGTLELLAARDRGELDGDGPWAEMGRAALRLSVQIVRAFL